MNILKKGPEMVIFAGLARKLFGSVHERRLKAMHPRIVQINALEESLIQLSDEELKTKTQEFRERLEKKETLDDLLVEAFAVVREAAKRVIGMRPFDVQLIGGIILHERGIAEMRTGEGKTLAATLPVYLNALTGKGVHVVTVNDYLASRDAEKMGQLYKFLGLTTGVITHNLNNDERRAAYNCDITYATNNELGFDYLRDNMAFSEEQMVQRGHHYALIDEVDSILIDEARTPLIISGPLEDRSEYYTLLDAYIPKLLPEDYEIDEKNKTVIFTEIGTEKIEQMLEKDGYLNGSSLYDSENITFLHHVNNALRAHKLFARDKDYIVRNNEVMIIDEFTGRMMPGRRYSDGLHQALEAKEKVDIQPENQTLASITFQNYFRLYEKLAGMTGTALTEAEEFSNIYNLDVVEIPTNLPIQRIDENDEIYRTIEEKYSAIIQDILAAHKRGQPILVGTTSIEKSEYLAHRLRQEKVKNFQILNARYHEQEAYIISQAGRPGAITIATNMAGRGTDIQLGGNLEMRIEQELKDMPDGPQRDEKLKKIEEDVAQLKEQALAAGGLYVLATERHESRRIDNQLRGRSGRQGDPGRSKFFLSLQDDLMRIFGSSRMDVMLKKFGLKEGESITHPWINKALEKAQTKVEARNFEMRKNLLKYDDVMNDQRKVIFDQRTEILLADDLPHLIDDIKNDVLDMLLDTYVPQNSYPDQWDIAGLKEELIEDFGLSAPIEEWIENSDVQREDLFHYLEELFTSHLNEKKEKNEESFFSYITKLTLLESIDSLWREHLVNLDHLRSAVGLRGYAQRDPLMEYKTEAFELFQKMLENIRKKAISKLMKHELVQRPNNDAFLSLNFIHPNAENEFQTEQQEASQRTVTNRYVTPQARNPNDMNSWGKVGRNELCPCGSKKKYKHCHGVLS